MPSSTIYVTRHRKSILIALCRVFTPAALVLCLCAPRVAVTPAGEGDRSAECALMEETCAEALEFQKQYESMPEEEQKDMAAVLKTYHEHCEQATRACKENSEGKAR